MNRDVVIKRKNNNENKLL